MNLVNYFKNILEKKNWLILGYFILNVCGLTVVTSFILSNSIDTELPLIVYVLIAISIYVLSLSIALSSFGERLLRFFVRAKEFSSSQDKQRVENIVNQLILMAKNDDINIDECIKVYQIKDNGVNVIAFGRNTLCVTSEALNLPDAHLASLILRELGKVYYGNTYDELAITIGNSLLFVMYTFSGAALTACLGTNVFSGYFTAKLFFNSDDVDNAFGGAGLLWAIILQMLIIVAAFFSGWYLVGNLIVKISNKKKELLADEFAAYFGYGALLCETIDLTSGVVNSFVAQEIVKLRPKPTKRIKHLKLKGVQY